MSQWVEAGNEMWENKFPKASEVNPEILLQEMNRWEDQEKEKKEEKPVEAIKNKIWEYGKPYANSRAYMELGRDKMGNTVQTHTIWGEAFTRDTEANQPTINNKPFDRDGNRDPKNNNLPEYIAMAIKRTPKTHIIYNGTGIVIIQEIISAIDNTESIVPSRTSPSGKDNYKKELRVMVDTDGDGTVDRVGRYPLSEILARQEFSATDILDGSKIKVEDNALNNFYTIVGTNYRQDQVDNGYFYTKLEKISETQGGIIRDTENANIDEKEKIQTEYSKILWNVDNEFKQKEVNTTWSE